MANEAKQFTIGGVTHDVMDVGARQAIASLQNAIDAITSGDTTTAIKTFQEVIDFLDGVTDDATLIGKLNELRTLIAAKYSKPTSGIPASDLADGVIPDVSGFATKTEVSAKANTADVVPKSRTVNGKELSSDVTIGMSDIQGLETAIADAGKVKSVTINGTKKTPDAQTGDVDLGNVSGTQGPQGPQGNSGVASADGVIVVNNLTEGGTDVEVDGVTKVKVLSAEMGKEIKRNYLNALDEITTPETIETETISEFFEGKQWYGYGKNIGTVWSAEPTNDSGSHCARIPFAAGDVLTVWGQGTGPANVWILLDEDNVIVKKSDKKYGGGATTPSASISESEPAVLNPDYNGVLLFSSKKNVPNGVTHQYTVMSHLNTADTENNGLMPKELAGVFDDDFFTLVDDLKQEPYQGDIDVDVLYDKAYYNCYNTASVGSTWTPTPAVATDKKCTKHNVKAGDIIDIWGQGTAPAALYVITDKDNIVRARDYGGRGLAVSTVFTQESPLTITSQWSGTLYMNCDRSVAFGATIHRTYDGAKRATTEQDGLMTMEQVAVVEELNSVLQSSGFSKKLIAVIGDSFSAPGRWQSRMNEILGSSTINVAHSGGMWASTNPSTDAYNQALSLVSNYANADRKPDYIICVLGVNDVNNAVTMGEVVYSNTIGTGSGEIDYSTFTGGIQAVLKTLKDNFTNSVIKVGFTPAGMMYMPANSEVTQRVETYLQRLQFVANLYGVGYIETRACGICRIVSSEMSAYSNNGDAHPGEAGHNRIGEYMARLMLSNL